MKQSNHEFIANVIRDFNGISKELSYIARSKNIVFRQSYFFGGYVRDALAGLDFKDVDVYVPAGSELTRKALHLLSSRLGYNVAIHTQKGSITNNKLLECVKCTISYGECSQDFDFVFQKEINLTHDYPYYLNRDIDVNYLASYTTLDPEIESFEKLKKHIFRCDRTESIYDIEDILQSVRSKEFKIDPNSKPIAPHRLENLKRKGFKEANNPLERRKKMSLPKPYPAVEATNSIQKPTLAQIFAKDAEKGAYRTGATQGIKALKLGLTKAFEHEGLSAEKSAAVLEALDTKLGEAFMRLLLGYGLMLVPIEGLQSNKYAQNLSEELRVSGLSEGMNYGAELAQKFLAPALMEAFKNTPMFEKEKVRLDDSTPSIEAEIAVDVEEAEEPSLKAVV